jgi:putative membrane protein
MNLRAYRTFQALILGGLGIFLFVKVMDGRILLYINRRFVILVLLAALALILLGQFILRERPPLQEEESVDPNHPGAEDRHSSRAGWALWLLALPLLIGLLVPERPLGASVLARRGINTASSYTIQGSAAGALEIPSTQRSVLDWIRVVSEEENPAAIDGQPADVTGFVYHDNRLGKEQFLVGRFSIACCVADATALGMVVDWPEAAALPDNQWVRVRGPVHLIQLDGKTLPAIAGESVEPVPEPEQPYLFP